MIEIDIGNLKTLSDGASRQKKHDAKIALQRRFIRHIVWRVRSVLLGT